MKKIKETYDIKLVRFSIDRFTKWSLNPWQYALKFQELTLFELYSLASHQKGTSSQIELIIVSTEWASDNIVHKALEVGDKIILTGPYGDFYLQEDSNREMFVLLGDPVAFPFVAILYFLEDQGMPRKSNISARSKRDLYDRRVYGT